MKIINKRIPRVKIFSLNMSISDFIDKSLDIINKDSIICEDIIVCEYLISEELDIDFYMIDDFNDNLIKKIDFQLIDNC